MAGDKTGFLNRDRVTAFNIKNYALEVIEVMHTKLVWQLYAI